MILAFSVEAQDAAPTEGPQETPVAIDVRAEDAAGNLSSLVKNYFSVYLSSLTTTNRFLADSTPTFTWERNSGAGAATIVLQSATDSDLIDGVHTSGTLAAATTGYTVPDVNALPEERYYWRVLRSGDTPRNVQTRSFVRVSSLASITPVPTTANAAVLSKAQLQANALTWTGITAPAGSSSCCYNIYLYLTPPTSDTAVPYLNFGVSQTSAGSTFAHIPSGIYYWRVQARIGYGADTYYGPFSAYRMFTYDATPSAEPALGAPVHHAVITTTRRPTFTWAACAVRVIGQPGGLTKFTSPARLAVYQRDLLTWTYRQLPPPQSPYIFRLIPPATIWDI
jgi:hypothetical protein